MSFSAISWAFNQRVGKSSAKFVLVAMADCVNGDGAEMACWPSCKSLIEKTGQDVKTVEAGLRRLRDEGFIVDTGERKGVTGQVIVYRLNTPENGCVTPLPKITFDATDDLVITGKTPVIGVVDTAGKTPVFPGKTPVFPMKHPRISHERPPKTGDGTGNEPGIEPVRKKEKTAHVCTNLGIPDGLLADFLAVRKAKRAGPLTETAIAGLQREAGKAGLTLEKAITACCEFGWQGFNSGWYAERQAKGQMKSMASKHADFDQQNYHESL